MSCDQTQKISIFELILNLTLAKKKAGQNGQESEKSVSHSVKNSNFFFWGGGGACPQTPIECCVVNFGSYIWYK